MAGMTLGFRYIQRLVDQFPPVKAFHFVLDHTECGLEKLGGAEQGEFHPPTSRMTNYVVFKFGELTRSYNVLLSWLSGLHFRMQWYFMTS
ncbi:uncharacterized protein LOC133719896 isoform X2 [Rosa rugosa]|nr:uncharacterized protein LOC133719896 isoform X2 [Rosa rugosa]